MKSLFLFFLAWKLYIELIVYWPIQLLISMAGGQRPPVLDYDLLVLGGRPKAALADERLIAAHSFFQGPCPMVYQASLAIVATEFPITGVPPSSDLPQT